MNSRWVLCERLVVAIPLVWALGLSVVVTESVAQNGPTLAGYPVYPSNNVWNTPVDSLPVDPNSASYITTIGGSTGVHPDFGSGTWEGAPIGIPYTTRL